ncbi:MAG: YciI family protein [Steroidobacterales bacterium]
MWYVIRGYDRAGTLAARRQARPDHLARLVQMRDAGRLLTAGPLPGIDSPDPGPAGFRGSLLILEFESQDAAEAWAAADPYVAAGVFERVEVLPYLQVLP